MRSSASLFTIPVLIAAGLQFSCSADKGPQPGSPPFLWNVARDNFAAHDFIKTAENLDRIIASENDYAARAQPWLLVLTSGMIRGYMDLADGLENAVRAKKSDPGGYRKYISNSRSAAGRHSLHFAEAFMRFQKGKDDPVLIAFNYPSGSAAPIPEITRALNGQQLPPPDLEFAQKHALERGVLLESCRAVGASDDTAKAAELFKAGDVKVARATFLTAMANSLYDQSQLYGPTKLDDPSKVKMFASLASDALKGVPESKQTKDLSEKIQKALVSKKKK